MKMKSALILAALIVVATLLAACVLEDLPTEGDIVTIPQPEEVVVTVYHEPDCLHDDERPTGGPRFELVARERDTFYRKGYEEWVIWIILVKPGGDLKADSYTCGRTRWSRIEVHYCLEGRSIENTASNVGWIRSKELERVR